MRRKLRLLTKNIVFEKQKDSKALTNSKTHFEVVWINPFNLFFINYRSPAIDDFIQEPITRSLQLSHIPVTAFLQTDLFLV